jgi:hypothetical protein
VVSVLLPVPPIDPVKLVIVGLKATIVSGPAVPPESVKVPTLPLRARLCDCNKKTVRLRKTAKKRGVLVKP